MNNGRVLIESVEESVVTIVVTYWKQPIGPKGRKKLSKR